MSKGGVYCILVQKCCVSAWAVGGLIMGFFDISLGCAQIHSSEMGYKVGPRLRESCLLAPSSRGREFTQPRVHFIAQLCTLLAKITPRGCVIHVCIHLLGRCLLRESVDIAKRGLNETFTVARFYSFIPLSSFKRRFTMGHHSNPYLYSS